MKLTVLVVDDSPDILELMRIMLEMSGFNVVTAISGRVALTLLRSLKPCLILCDMKMQDIGGSEFYEILEKTMPNIFNTTPVVFVTGMEDPPKNAAGFIRKPFETKDVMGVWKFLT